jgi:hypothetical protein
VRVEYDAAEAGVMRIGHPDYAAEIVLPEVIFSIH